MDPLQVANAVRKLCPTVDLSESALIATGKILKEQLHSVVKNARILARHSKRLTINAEDVNRALGLLGQEAVYGARRFENQRLIPVDGKEIFFAEDADISTSEVNSVVLERPPGDVHIHSHWLAIEGVQPRVPENETLPVAKGTQERVKRPSVSKDPATRKRKGYTETVQAVSGGMVHGGVELRLPVEHALTAEQQAYYEQIRQHIESVATESDSQSPEARKESEKKIDALQFDAALQPLIPYLIRFASQHVYATMHNLQSIHQTLRILHSLVRNKHLDLGLYSHHILPLLLSCLLSESLGQGNLNQHGDVCKVKDYAAAVLASAVEAFDDPISNVHFRISQRLTDCLDPEASLIVKHGAIRGLDALGMTRVEAVQKLLQMCSRHIEDQLLNLAPTSLTHLQGTTCVSLIEEILERTRDEDAPVDHVLSPLQKKARKEDSFI